MRCLAQCFANNKVSASDLIEIVVAVANDVFDQDWRIEGDLEEDTVSSESESEEEGEKTLQTEVDVNNTPEESKTEVNNTTESVEEGTSTRKAKKCCKKAKYKTNLFPYRRSINKWLEDATYLNLKLAAEEILNKESSTVTVGIDDTQKAAGHKMF